MPSNLDGLIAEVRGRMTELLTGGLPTRETAILLADLEEEQSRRAETDGRLKDRLSALDTAGPAPKTESVLDRPLPAGVDHRAGTPRSHRAPTDAERARGIAIAYGNANPTFYRALIERLRDGEKFRLETQHGDFEMTREEFEMAVPAMVRTASYQRGTDTVPGASRYVTGRVPKTLERFRVG